MNRISKELLLLYVLLFAYVFYKEILQSDVSKHDKLSQEEKRFIEKSETVIRRETETHAVKHNKKEPIKNQDKDDVNNLCDESRIIKPNTKVLSFALFGKIRKYYMSIPTIVKEKRALAYYKTWIIRIYHDGNIPEFILKDLIGQEDIQICDGRRLPRYGNLSYIFPMFWRFVAIADPSVDVFCSRDIDSPMMERETDAVHAFMRSDAVLHTMRDHPQHNLPILGGLWCYKNMDDRKTGRMYLESIIEKAKTHKKLEDQTILNLVIWSPIRKSGEYHRIMQHDTFSCKQFTGSVPFPKQRRYNDYYIGRPGHQKTKNTLNKKKFKDCPKECRPNYGKNWNEC